MSDGKKILEEVKSSVKEAKKQESLKYKPWYINMGIWLFDLISVVVILALAIFGLRALLKEVVTLEAAIAISILVVLFFAWRTVEKVYRNRI